MFITDKDNNTYKVLYNIQSAIGIKNISTDRIVVIPYSSYDPEKYTIVTVVPAMD